jgi:hypothetical protein
MVANTGTDALPRSRAFALGFAGHWRQCFVLGSFFKYLLPTPLKTTLLKKNLLKKFDKKYLFPDILGIKHFYSIPLRNKIILISELWQKPEKLKFKES